MLAGEQDIKDQEDRAYGDSGIGNVESWPAVGADEDFDEIGDSTVENAVGDVAGSSAEKESKTGSVELAQICAAYEQPGNDANYCDGSCDQADAQNGRGGIGEDAEGYARISTVNEVDKVVDELVAPGIGSLRIDPGFGGAVEEDNGEGEPDPAEAAGEDHADVFLALRLEGQIG
jgi:hypothetical protein